MSEGAMTREEIIAIDSQIARRCRGPLPQAARDKINAMQKEAKETNNDELATAADLLNTSARVRCGYDMNEIFLSGPLDGKSHEYTCPKCGIKGEYTAAGPSKEDLEASVKGLG